MGKLKYVLVLTVLVAGLVVEGAPAGAHGGSCTWTWDAFVDNGFPGIDDNVVIWQAFVQCGITQHYKFEGGPNTGEPATSGDRATAWMEWRESDSGSWDQFTGLDHEPDHQPWPARDVVQWSEDASCKPPDGSDVNDDFRIHIHDVRVWQPQGTLDHHFGDYTGSATARNSGIFDLNACNGTLHDPHNDPHHN